MTDRQTATEPEVEKPTKEKPDSQREPTESDAPAGTRELRDAQRRPAIRAEGAQEAAAPTVGNAPLFDEAAGQKLRGRWQEIQTGFVDEPRNAVEKADALVAEVLKHLTDTFARERDELEASWARTEGEQGETNTEELRLAIQRYRSFFDRLLSF